MNRLNLHQRVDLTPTQWYRLGWQACDDAYRYDFWFALCMGWVLVEAVRQLAWAVITWIGGAG